MCAYPLAEHVHVWLTELHGELVVYRVREWKPSKKEPCEVAWAVKLQ